MKNSLKLIAIQTEKGIIVKDLDDIARDMKSNRILELFEETRNVNVRNNVSSEATYKEDRLKEINELLNKYAEDILHTKMISTNNSKKEQKAVIRAVSRYVDNTYIDIYLFGNTYKIKIGDKKLIEKMLLTIILGVLLLIVGNITGTTHTTYFHYLCLITYALMIFNFSKILMRAISILYNN